MVAMYCTVRVAALATIQIYSAIARSVRELECEFPDACTFPNQRMEIGGGEC